MRLSAEGMAAAEKEDVPTWVAKLEQAVELRNDVPELLLNLAAAQTAARKPEDALATLQRVAGLGVVAPVDKADEFESLRGRKEFADLAKKFLANNRPQGRGEIAFTLSDVTGLIEGIAWREKTDEFYFGDVNGRAIWRRLKDGKLRRLTEPAAELLGVFGIAIDEARGTIWAATAAVPAMSGNSPEVQGTGALAEIDLETGAIRRVFPTPRPARGEAMNQPNDLVVASDGAVYMTDGGERCIWRLANGGDRLELFLRSPEFFSLQGITLLPTGVMVVADKLNGLLRIETATGEVRRFEPPADITLVGVDGLAATGPNSVVAVQSGLRPTRVLRIDFDPTADAVRKVTVLESAHYTMQAATLGCLGAKGKFYFVGNGGWPRFEGSDGEPISPRPVPIFETVVAGR